LASRPPVGSSRAGCGVKPGHWACAALEDAKANHFDFADELEMITMGRDGSPLAIEATPFEMAVCRDVTLAKGKARSLESLGTNGPRNLIATAPRAVGPRLFSRCVLELC
jgi:hypothetical protein